MKRNLNDLVELKNTVGKEGTFFVALFLTLSTLYFGVKGIQFYNYVKNLAQTPKAVFIDEDKLADLVIGDKIFLADQTSEGITYKPLTNSDIYRIK